MSGSPSRLSDAETHAPAERGGRRLDLLKAGVVVDPKQLLDALPLPAQPAREFGPDDPGRSKG